MSKAASAGMVTHLGEEVTSLATCSWLTRRDGVEFFFTDHDAAILYDGDTYRADSSYSRTAIQNDAGLAVDNLDIAGVFDTNEITEVDMRAGLFDYARVRLFTINWANISDGIVKMRSGYLGEVSFTTQGVFKAELRGLTQVLGQNILETYQPECRADLGDARCKLPIEPDVDQRSTAYALGDFIKVSTGAGSTQEQYENRIYECTVAGTSAVSAPTYDTTPGNTTVDGTATFTCREAWMRNAVVASVTDRVTFSLTISESRDVDDWFNWGALEFEDGDNAGRVIEIKDWVQTGSVITLFLPTAFTITVGTKVRLYPGCNKQATTCETKFDFGEVKFVIGNMWNFRGENALPGIDALMRYPDAK